MKRAILCVINAKDNKGKTALDYAKTYSVKQLILNILTNRRNRYNEVTIILMKLNSNSQKEVISHRQQEYYED